MAGAGASAVQGTQRHRPVLSTPIGGIERARKVSEALQREEPLNDHEFRFDARGAGEFVPEADRPLEQAAVSHVDLDAVTPIAQQDVLDAIASLQYVDGKREASDIDGIGIARRCAARVDRQDERVDVRAPEDGITGRRAAGRSGESATPKDATRGRRRARR